MQEQILAELEESYAAARRVPGADDSYWNAFEGDLLRVCIRESRKWGPSGCEPESPTAARI